MKIKKLIGKIHLWLGLASGIVVFVVAMTGCIYAFQAEIRDLVESYRFVEAEETAVLPPSVLKAIAEKELPGKHLHAVLYDEPQRSAQVIFFHFEPDYYYYHVFVNQYTGEVLKVKDMSADFFQFILNGHFYFWLPAHIGQPFVASMTLGFLVMLVTGIVLWWPKKKKSARQRFTLKWDGGWRRKNYDLHNVLGFYACWIALILAFTGLVWGFEWFANGLHAVAGGEKSVVYYDPVSEKNKLAEIGRPAIDRVWDLMKAEYPAAEVIEVHIPETGTSSIAANANPDRSTYWKTDYRYFDQYSLKELEVSHIYSRFEEATPADKLLRMNYDIHVGAIAGMPGKIIAFMASLVVGSLPVTGFIMWLGRKSKKKKHKKKDRTRGRRSSVRKMYKGKKMETAGAKA